MPPLSRPDPQDAAAGSAVAPVAIRSAAATRRGRDRRVNQDAVLCDAGLGLFAAADGLGGFAGGERASQTAVAALREAYRRPGPGASSAEIGAALPRACEAAAAAVYAARQPDAPRAGTTLVAAAVLGPVVVIAHVGDSRAYLIEHGHIIQLTEDQTAVSGLRREGLLTESQARDHPSRHMLSGWLGRSPRVRPQSLVRPLPPGATLLLATDGLWGFVTPQTIGECFTANSPPEAWLERLIDAALAGGSGDDITAVAVRTGE